MSDRRSFIALDWVNEEISETLKQAVEALDGFISNPEDVTRLRFCLTYVFQVSGSLKMIELEGAALLAKEIETLLGKAVDNGAANTEQQLEMAGIVRHALEVLSAYVVKVSETHADAPEALLETMNQVRAANKGNEGDALSASDVFNPDVSSAANVERQEPAIAVDEFNDLIRRLRQGFQKGLIGIVRGQNMEANLVLVNKVCLALHKVSRKTASAPLWKIAAAICEHMRQPGQDIGLESKKALKQIDNQIKALEEKGRSALQDTPDAALLKSLLYSVATADPVTDLIRELRAEYQLDAALDRSDEATEVSFKVYADVVKRLQRDIEALAADLSHPHTVNHGLARIVQTLALLDISQAQTELAEAQGYLDLSSNTLDAEQADAIRQQLQALNTSLSSQLEQREGIEQANAFVERYKALIAESREGLEAIKEQIVEYVATQWEPGLINELPQLINQQQQVLNLSPFYQLQPVLDCCQRYVTEKLLTVQQAPEWSVLESLADAISSVEYYLECAIGDSESNLESIVTVAKQSVTVLGYQAEEMQFGPMQLEPVAVEDVPVAETSAEVENLFDDDIDEEILEIFAEEAAEVFEHINQYLPRLQDNVNDGEALTEVRRSYHTLKGSGRMVGAEAIGDFAWSVERMLNKVLDGGSPLTPNAVAIVAEATAIIPALLASFENKTPVDAGVLKAVIQKADAEWEGKALESEPELEIDAGVEDAPELSSLEEDSETVPEFVDATDDAEAPSEAVVEPVAEEAAAIDDDIDEEILDIFIEEAGEVLERINDHLPRLQGDTNDQEALTEVRRSYHTLKGSGRMVGAETIGDFAWSVERMLNKVMDGGAELTPNAVTVVADATAIIPALLSGFENKTALPATELKAVIARADAEWEGKAATADAEIEAELPLESAESSEPEIEEELLEIFLAEAEAHIGSFSAFLEDIDPGYEDVEVTSDLQRALHTLKGSAYMAGITAMAELVTPLESFVKDLSNFQVKADAEILAIFMRANDLLQQQLKGLSAGSINDVKGVDALTEEVRVLHATRIEVQEEEAAESFGLADKYTALLSDALDCLTASEDLIHLWKQEGLATEGRQSLMGHVERLSSTAREANFPEVADLSAALASFYGKAQGDITPAQDFFELADKAHEELDDMMDIIAASQVVDAADSLITMLEQFTVEASTDEPAEEANDTNVEDMSLALPDVSDDDAGIELPVAETIEIAEPADVAVDTAAHGESQDQAVLHAQLQEQLAAADEDTLEIFLEEAEELLELIEAAVSEWSNDRGNPEHPAEAKRVLHTLKGGARLAELGVLGDLTHDYESTIEAAEVRAGFDDAFFVAIHDYQRQLVALINTCLGSGNEEAAPALDDVLIGVAPEPVVETVEEAPLTETAPVVAETQAQDALADLKAELAEQYQQADEDTLEIFIEEAGELVEALDTASSAWLAAHDDTAQADELKRVLHTLKGGARLAELAVLGDLTHNYETMIESAEVRSAFNDAFFAELQKYQDQTQQLVDFILQGAKLETTAAPTAAEPLLTIAEPAPTLVPDALPEQSEEDELVSLFVEEADELSEGIEECIANFLKDRDDKEPLEELKRLLHTLKGGARLAGVTQMGDLSHDFETFVINQEREGTLASEAFVDEMQGFHDQLNKHLAELRSQTQQAPAEQASAKVVPIRPDVDTSATSVQATQAAIDATRNFIENFNKESQQRGNREPVKLAPDLLESLINLAGESSIGRSRIEESISELGFSLEEMDMTIDRLHGQIRRLEIETEAQIIFRQEQVDSDQENFDPLEMDRYSHMQQLSKSLMEATSDLDDISGTLNNKMRDMETLLVQQARINTELQEGLMRAQMVPFSRMVPRLRRIIRQVASELGKKVEFSVENAEGELDRTILERMVAPLEHMLRNAVDHGIEMPDVREAAGKSDTGSVVLALSREGGEVVLTLRDNGAGIKLAAVRKKAIERGLIKEDSQLSDHEILQFILHAGFSTAEKVTQISGRGVGMDVVHSEIKQMGGSVEISSKEGEGTQFIVRLPFTVSVNRALMVCIGSDTYAIPLNTIEGIVRVSPYELEAYYQPDAPMFEYAGQSYNLRYMGSLLQRGSNANLEGVTTPLPVVLIRSSDYSVAVQVDRLLGSQEVVVKSLGPQFGMVEGLSGATVLGDGSVVVILDMLAMIRADANRIISEEDLAAEELHAADIEDQVTRVMVVDDSVTVRKVTSRLLERYGLEVILAKDGLDAITQLQEMEKLPHVMLLDIEMPRMDGFEVVSRVRHNNRLQNIPICMITSRTGEKHRERALALGATKYLGKPFQERELLVTISELTGTEVLEA